MSWNPETRLAYYPAIHRKWMFSDSAMELASWKAPDWKFSTGVGYEAIGTPRSDSLLGTLQAWDPVRRKLAWEVPLQGFWNPGTMTSAGNLVFQGRADGNFVAYNATTGAELWRVHVGSGISAPPISYSVDGRQYVALLVGWGGAAASFGGAHAAAYGWSYGAQPRRLIAFSLEGTAVLPPPPGPQVVTPLAAKEFGVDLLLAATGSKEFGGTCNICHGGNVISGGVARDLRASGVVLSASAFADVVRGGSRAASGMPRFKDLTDDQLLAIRHFIRQRAEASLAAPPK